MRRSIQHLVGIAGYNLFWECVYYQVLYQLYPSLWPSDSVTRMEWLGEQPIPRAFQNGAAAVAEATMQWWTEKV